METAITIKRGLGELKIGGSFDDEGDVEISLINSDVEEYMYLTEDQVKEIVKHFEGILNQKTND